MRFMNNNYCTASATVVTASNINPNFPTTNLKNPLRSKRVRTSDGTTTLEIVFDMITSEDINSAVLLWPKEDGIRLSETATIKVQANATNVWTSPTVDETLTVNNTYMVASHYFTSGQSYRYWRVVIEDAGNPYDFIELGLVWLGTSLDIGNAENGFEFKQIDPSQTMSNDFGHQYTDEYPLRSILQINYRLLEYTTVQVLENAYRLNGIKKPVMVILDPTEAIFDKDHFGIYGKLNAQFGLKHINYNLFDADSINIVELS